MAELASGRGEASRERQVRRVLLIEGASNLVVMLAKVAVGLASGSALVFGDALHSLTDLANNGVALVAARVAASPPDREHPYGHAKFETLAVFFLAVLLSVLAVELAFRALTRVAPDIERSTWGLALMLGVLAVNTSVTLWEGRWAQRLDSDLLRADAGHTASDVLVTSAVIVGWQLSARGLVWLDRTFSLAIAALILFLAWKLLRRAIPVLVDRMAADPDELARVVRSVRGVREARRVRSQHAGGSPRIDVVVSVDPRLGVEESHAIADAIERTLYERFGARDVTVHVEPDVPPAGDRRTAP